MARTRTYALELGVLLSVSPIRRSVPGGEAESALTLLVAQVVADHHDPTVTADHLALLADLLDARINLHVSPIFYWSTQVV